MTERSTISLSGFRVMVAEDQLVIAELIEEFLLSLDCVVVGPVRDIDDALCAISANEIDGALLDLNLGGARIDPAVRELALRNIPFIMMTGQGNLLECPTLIAQAPVLYKPFKIQQLEDIMMETFRPQAGSAASAGPEIHARRLEPRI
jgi:DNA-binding NtrC family response regulator